MPAALLYHEGEAVVLVQAANVPLEAGAYSPFSEEGLARPETNTQDSTLQVTLAGGGLGGGVGLGGSGDRGRGGLGGGCGGLGGGGIGGG